MPQFTRLMSGSEIIKLWQVIKRHAPRRYARTVKVLSLALALVLGLLAPDLWLPGLAGQLSGQPGRSGAGAAWAAGASYATGPSLQDRRHQRDQDKRMKDEADFTSKICETRITASIHWPSFATRGKRVNAVGYCDVALSAIERICRENKSKVQRSIRHLQCGAGDKRRVVLNGSSVQYAVSPRPARNDHEYVYKQLKRKL